MTVAIDIDGAINAAHRAAADLGIQVSPRRVSRLVRRYFHAQTAAERRQLLANPDDARVIAYLDPTGETACANVVRNRHGGPK